MSSQYVPPRDRKGNSLVSQQGYTFEQLKRKIELCEKAQNQEDGVHLRFMKWTRGPRQLYRAILDYIAVSDIETLRGDSRRGIPFRGVFYPHDLWKVKFLSESYPERVERPNPFVYSEVNPLCRPDKNDSSYRRNGFSVDHDENDKTWWCLTFAAFDDKKEIVYNSDGTAMKIKEIKRDASGKILTWKMVTQYTYPFGQKLEKMYNEYLDLKMSPDEPGKLAKVDRKGSEIKQALYDVTEKYFKNKVGRDLLENLPENAQGVELDNCYIPELRNQIWSIKNPTAQDEWNATADNRIPLELWRFVKDNLAREDIDNVKLTSKSMRQNMINS